MWSDYERGPHNEKTWLGRREQGECRSGDRKHTYILGGLNCVHIYVRTDKFCFVLLDILMLTGPPLSGSGSIQTLVPRQTHLALQTMPYASNQNLVAWFTKSIVYNKTDYKRHSTGNGNLISSVPRCQVNIGASPQCCVRISTITVRFSTITVRISTITVRISTITVRISTITVRISTITVFRQQRQRLTNDDNCLNVGERRYIPNGLVCWSLTSLCHSNGHIETMPAREITIYRMDTTIYIYMAVSREC